MEVSALKYPAGVGRYGRSPLLRIQSDEHLIKLIRSGNDAAFEVVVSRYETRLLSFCRHLLSSREDAEDVLQDAFSAAYHAILADDRPINVRPWLYRIARNRCLNHLRRVPAVPTDTMDILFAEHGETTADKVHRREEFRLLVGDIHELAETQRTALLLREMDALSYEQIAEAMETTVSSVKSLLVRARVSLAEASEARLLSCEDVRGELGEVAEGLTKRPNTLVRRHLKTCDRCTAFNKQLRRTNRALGALLPVGPLALLKGGVLSHLTGGHSAAAASGSAATAGAGSSVAGTGTVAGVAGAGASTSAVGAAAGSTSGFVSAGIGALATKAAAGLAVAAVFTAGVAVTNSPTHHASKLQAIATKTHATHARTALAASASRSSAASAGTGLGFRATTQGTTSARSSATAAGTPAATATGSAAPKLSRSATRGTHTASVSSLIGAAATSVATAGGATSAAVAGSAAGSSTSPSASSTSKRHGTAIPSNSSANSAGTSNLLPLGALTTPSSAPALPGTGGSANSAPSSSFPAAGSTDSGNGGPVVGAVTQVITTITGTKAGS